MVIDRSRATRRRRCRIARRRRRRRRPELGSGDWYRPPRFLPVVAETRSSNHPRERAVQKKSSRAINSSIRPSRSNTKIFRRFAKNSLAHRARTTRARALQPARAPRLRAHASRRTHRVSRSRKRAACFRDSGAASFTSASAHPKGKSDVVLFLDLDEERVSVVLAVASFASRERASSEPRPRARHETAAAVASLSPWIRRVARRARAFVDNLVFPCRRRRSDAAEDGDAVARLLFHRLRLGPVLGHPRGRE